MTAFRLWSLKGTSGKKIDAYRVLCLSLCSTVWMAGAKRVISTYSGMSAILGSWVVILIPLYLGGSQARREERAARAGAGPSYKPSVVAIFVLM